MRVSSDTALRQLLTAQLDSPVVALAPVAGGDISDAYCAECEGGARVFVKARPGAPSGMPTAEAKGLAWLRGSHGLRVPEVLATREADDGGPALVVLEWIEAGQPQGDFDERLGRGLALLHRQGAAAYGLDYDNFIGPLTQVNAGMAGMDWATFYGQARLWPQLQRAIHDRRTTTALTKGCERLIERLPGVVGEPSEGPSRLHGDLWGGNVMCDNHNTPVLVDPAVYGGDREVDLAMMRLFGGFSDRVFDAYREAFPLRSGFEERLAVYQLYPLLVHVNLFGGHYVARAEAVVSAF